MSSPSLPSIVLKPSQQTDLHVDFGNKCRLFFGHLSIIYFFCLSFTLLYGCFVSNSNLKRILLPFSFVFGLFLPLFHSWILPFSLCCLHSLFHVEYSKVSGISKRMYCHLRRCLMILMITTVIMKTYLHPHTSSLSRSHSYGCRLQNPRYFCTM